MGSRFSCKGRKTASDWNFIKETVNPLRREAEAESVLITSQTNISVRLIFEKHGKFRKDMQN